MARILKRKDAELGTMKDDERVGMATRRVLMYPDPKFPDLPRPRPETRPDNENLPRSRPAPSLFFLSFSILKEWVLLTQSKSSKTESLQNVVAINRNPMSSLLFSRIKMIVQKSC